MKKAALKNPFDDEVRVWTTLGQDLDDLDRVARAVLARIANERARASTEHPYHSDLSAIEVAVADMLVPLAKRRM